MLWDSLGGWVFFSCSEEQAGLDTARSGAAEP